MNIKIDINCDNAAFNDDNGSLEVARILRELSDSIEHYSNFQVDKRLFDGEGNHVGNCYTTGSRLTAFVD